jgi:hypothetical protein
MQDSLTPMKSAANALALVSSCEGRQRVIMVVADLKTGAAAVDQEGAGAGEGRQVGADPEVRLSTTCITGTAVGSY